MQNSYPKSLNVLLKESNLDVNILQTIQKHAQVLIKINNTVINLLPVELKNCCRVANYRRYILILEVTNASRKARLNYELSTLHLKLRNTILPSLYSINITINPSLSYNNVQNYLSVQKLTINQSTHIPNSLSQESAKKIRNLAKYSTKKLQEKLERLAELVEKRTKEPNNIK